MDYKTKEMQLNVLLRFRCGIQEVVIALCADKEYDHPCLLAFRLVLEIHRICISTLWTSDVFMGQGRI